MKIIPVFNPTLSAFINSLPKHNLSKDLILHEIPLFKALVSIGFCNSNKEAKRLISENGARVNDQIITNIEYSLKIDDFNEPLKISAGKKRHVLVTID